MQDLAFNIEGLILNGVFIILFFFILYWVIRLAIRHELGNKSKKD